MGTVDILLSVYGKAEFLGEFLLSLKQQEHQEYNLLYRFDGEAGPEAEKLLEDFPKSKELSGRKHKGIVHSYQTLLNASSADYLMFADQDDVWHSDKISVSMAEIRKQENFSGKDVPVLVHSDLRVVDRCGRMISDSLWKYQSLCPQKKSLQDLMIQNNITGCTVIFNRALASLANTFPDEAICHDWYLAMIAAAFGKIAYIDRALIDYRQHPDNVFGAVPRSNLIAKCGRRCQLHERLILTQRQAGAFLTQYGQQLAPEQIQALEIWAKMSSRSYLKRLYMAFRHKFRKNDRLRTLGLWWAL